MRAEPICFNPTPSTIHLIEWHLDAVTAMVAESAHEHPVGFVLDLTCEAGRRLGIHLTAALHGVSTDEATASTDRHFTENSTADQSAAHISVADSRTAEAATALLGPTADNGLRCMRRLLGPGRYPLVVVGSDGTGLFVTEVTRPVADGQHRVRFDFPSS